MAWSSRASISANTVVTVIFAFMLAIGLFVSFIGVMGLSATLSTGGWSVNEGTVVETGIYRQWDNGGRNSPGHWTYFPVVSYQYQVKNMTYTSSKITATQVGSDYNYALGVVNKYPNGTMVTVHYDPNNPADSVLDTSIGSSVLISLIIGIVFTGIGAGACGMSALAGRGFLDLDKAPT